MSARGSGLDVKDRQWLKMNIPSSFIGSDLVDWLHKKVEGLSDRRDARRYAASLLKAGFIKHTTDKTNFSEQTYYSFADPVQQQMAQRELLNNKDLPPHLNHLRYGATHLAADAMSLLSETSVSTIRDFGPVKTQVQPSAAAQAGWNLAPAAAHGPQFGHMLKSINETDNESVISISSSISQAHLKAARAKMEKIQKKKLSKSAQSVGYKTGSGSSGSNSSNSKGING